MVSGTRQSRIILISIVIHENRNDYILFILKNRDGNVTLGLLLKVNNLFLPSAQPESNGAQSSDWQDHTGDQPDRFLHTHYRWAHFWGQTGLEKRAEVHWQDPMGQFTGLIFFAQIMASTSTSLGVYNNTFLPQLFDERQCKTAKDMFHALCTHIKYATNGGNLR